MGSNATPRQRGRRAIGYDGQLARDLPHLKNVWLTSPLQRSQLSLYDYDEDWHIVRNEHTTLRYNDTADPDELSNIVSAHYGGVDTRVLVVEDISSYLIERFVNLLDISVEVFEEHLISCGWPGNSSNQNLEPDPDSSTWNSRRVGKSHCSMVWLRLFKTDHSDRLMDITDRTLAVQDDGSTDEDDKYQDDPVVYNIKYLINTWRNHVNLGSTNKHRSDRHRVSTRLTHGALVAAEERVTIWHGTYNNHKLVLILVDAGFGGFVQSPVATGEVTEDRLMLIRDKNATFRQTISRAKVQSGVRRHNRGSNVHPQIRGNVIGDRRQTDLSSISNSQSQKPGDKSKGKRPDLDTQATTNVEDEGGSSHQAIELQDSTNLQDESIPMTKLPSSVGTNAQSTQPELGSDNASSSQTAERITGHGGSSQSISELQAEQSSESDSASTHDGLVEGTTSGGFEPPTVPRTTLIRNIASRNPIGSLQISEAQQMGYLAALTTTREDFASWLQFAASLDTLPSFKFGPVAYMYTMVHYDTMDTLQAMEKHLDDVIRASDNEVEVQKNITSWREMLGYFDQQLRHILFKISKFDSFLTGPKRPPQHGANQNFEGVPSLEDLEREINRIRGHIQQTYALITSSISVAESRRGLAEAESVTRLTELAFIYIPLSFAASFFGMQVKELNPATTSIVGFVALSLVVVTISYSVRLVIRSQFLIRLQREMMTSVHELAKVKDGQPLRTRDFGLWIWHKCTTSPFYVSGPRPRQANGFIVLICLSGIIVMVSVWSNANLSSSMKIAISLPVVLAVTVLMMFGCFSVVNFIAGSGGIRRRRRRRRRLSQ